MRRYYLVNALKFAVLALVPFAAWYLAWWLLGGNYGKPQPGPEPFGWGSEFLLLFMLILLVGIVIATRVLWGGHKTPDSERSMPQDWG